MSVLAAIRPDDETLAVFVHVLGAMVLVGGLLAGAGALAFARGDARILRIGYWALLLAALPGFVVMRVGAQWIYTKQGWDDLEEEPAWIGIGFVTADLGGLVFLATLVLGGVGVRRLRSGQGGTALTVALALSVILLAAYVVTVWAMAGKPD